MALKAILKMEEERKKKRDAEKNAKKDAERAERDKKTEGVGTK